MSIILKRNSRLDDAIRVESLRGVTFTKENGGHRFVISCFRDEEHQSLTGTISVRFMRSDGVTILLGHGAESGRENFAGIDEEGNAFVLLHQDCYNVPGRFQIAVFNTADGSTTCIYAAVGMVQRTQGEALIDSGDIIGSVDDLIAEIQRVEKTIPADYSTLSSTVSQHTSKIDAYLSGTHPARPMKFNDSSYAYNGSNSYTSVSGLPAGYVFNGFENVQKTGTSTYFALLRGIADDIPVVAVGGKLKLSLYVELNDGVESVLTRFIYLGTKVTTGTASNSYMDVERATLASGWNVLEFTSVVDSDASNTSYRYLQIRTTSLALIQSIKNVYVFYGNVLVPDTYTKNQIDTMLDDVYTKAQTDAKIAESISEVEDMIPEDVVKYSAVQELTDNQKKQARENIGASDGSYAKNAGIESLENVLTYGVRGENSIDAGGFTWTHDGETHILTIQEGTHATSTNFGYIAWNIIDYIGTNTKLQLDITSLVVPGPSYGIWGAMYLSKSPSDWGTSNIIKNMNSFLPNEAKKAEKYTITIDAITDFSDVGKEQLTVAYLIIANSSAGSSVYRPGNTLTARLLAIPSQVIVRATELVGFDQNGYYTKSEVDELIEDAKAEPIKRAICWGDSLTAGTGGGEGKPSGASVTNYPAMLQELITDGTTVLNAGVGGETSWMIASRQGGQQLYVEPFTIRADTIQTYIKLIGQEHNVYHNGSDYVYDDENDKTSYNVNCESANGYINPCYIAGVKGTMSREKVSAGEPDPETGETATTDTYNYYFARETEGTAVVIDFPVPVVTDGYKNHRGDIAVIWAGQNDKINNVTQKNAFRRARAMVETLTNDRYIVMSRPTGSNQSYVALTEEFVLEFGNHYINIREWLCKYGVAYANSLGAGIVISSSDQELIDAGTIPACLRSDGVHGNYWYYRCVAKAVYDKGKSLGYWS